MRKLLLPLQYFLDQTIFLMLHLTGGATFPKPLTMAEERYYLEEFKNGNIEARNVLIERNLRLVAHIIKKYYATSKDQDDLVSIGTIGLIKGISTFNHQKGARLATYAARCIENEILMYFRNQKKRQNDVNISDPIETDSEGNSLTFLDIICEEEAFAENLDLKINSKKLYEFLEKFPEREKKILIMRYGLYNSKAYTQREISKKLGISRSYVSRIESRAIKRMNEYFMKSTER
ncbi:MAG: RNA polymerase sporulation sigma factor SigK [Clostridia bacterium]|nr:RNA polymerase sporulation sigma factor SigK [Clostridia bacterium]